MGPNFHWLHNTGVGIDQCFTGGIVPANLKTGTVAISNRARLEGNTVSDHGIALMMALSRGLDQYVRHGCDQEHSPPKPIRGCGPCRAAPS